MPKSFVSYIIPHVEEELVDCNYFMKGKCWAQPFATHTKMESYQAAGAEDFESYSPTEEDQKQYCKNTVNFRTCPRLQAYRDYLKAVGR